MKNNLVVVILGFLLFGIILSSPTLLAQETLTNPGVTPDSFLWGIDKALEQISLLLATSPNAKATKGLEHAEERLAEIKVMIEENKLDAAKKAQEEHGKTLAGVQESIEEIEEDNSTEEMKEVIKIEKELQDHENEVNQVFGELKIKIKIEGEITASQQALIDSILASLEGQTGKVEIEIKNKKDKTKIKIKIETGKSDEEVDEDIEKLEIKAGLGEIKVRAEIVNGQAEVKLKIKFSTTTTDRNVIIDEIIEKFSLERDMADAALKIEEEEEDEELEEKFKVKVKVKEGTADIKIELKFILDTTDREEILDAIVERSQLTREQIESAMKFRIKEKEDEEDDELEIEVEIEDGVAEIEVELNGDKFEFSLETTDRDAIIDEIIERTGLTRAQIEAVIEFDIEDEDEKETSVKRITVEIFQQSNSGQSGNATLTDVEGATKVVLSFDVGVPDDILQPAHIHTGSCTELGSIVYPLSDVSGIGTGPGGSDTTIDESLNEILSQKPLAINVHKSKDEISISVSCGNIIFN